MISSTAITAAFEAYLLATMVRLCGDNPNVRDSDHDGCRQIEDLSLFDIDTPFERVARALGLGATGWPQIIENVPESLRESVEHRYALSRWPDFDFRILESRGGLAWGQMFVRRLGVVPPPVCSVADLRAWSHVESEVEAALGAPVLSEEWPPWKSVSYRAGTTEYVLCYVYALLQRVEVRKSTNG